MQSPAEEGGVTLIETLIAVLIAVVGVVSVGGLIFQATVTKKNQGTEVTRATIYAQDKMEKLLSLDFTNCTQTASAFAMRTGLPETAEESASEDPV